MKSILECIDFYRYSLQGSDWVTLAMNGPVFREGLNEGTTKNRSVK